MLKEFSWYITENRFSGIAREIDESVRAWATAKEEAHSETEIVELREKARSLCESHCVMSGLHTADSSFLNLDAEFLEGSSLNEPALNLFIKEVIKAHCYQKVLWTYMGTTGNLTQISKTEMANQGIDHTRYLPEAYKKANPEPAPLEKKLEPNTVPVYLYGDGTVSTNYSPDRAKLQFNNLSDKSGFDWKSGYDPNTSVDKKDWTGGFDETGTWKRYDFHEGINQRDSNNTGNVIPIYLIKNEQSNTASLYDPAGLLINPAAILYYTVSGDYYGAKETDQKAIMGKIAETMKTMKVTSITTVYGTSEKPGQLSRLYKNVLGSLAPRTIHIEPASTAAARIEQEREILQKKTNERSGVYVEKSIHAIQAQGLPGKDIPDTLVTGTTSAPLSPLAQHDAELLGLQPGDTTYLSSLVVPEEKKEQFASAIANIFVNWDLYAKTGMSKREMIDAVHAQLSGKPLKNTTVTTETTFASLATGSVEHSITDSGASLVTSGIPGVFGDSAQTVSPGDPKSRLRFLKDLEKRQQLPKGGAKVAESLLDTTSFSGKEWKSIENVLSNYREISASTGMTIAEAIQAAVHGSPAKGSERVHYELDLGEVIDSAAERNYQQKSIPLDRVIDTTEPVVIVGGLGGTSLADSGIRVAEIRKRFGNNAKEAEKTMAFLDTIHITNAATLPAFVSLIKESLKTSNGKGFTSFRNTFLKTLDARQDVSYNLFSDTGLKAYERSTRFRNTGLSRDALAAMVETTKNKPFPHAPTTIINGETVRTIEPQYISRTDTVAITKTKPRGFPEPVRAEITRSVDPISLRAARKPGTPESILVETAGTTLRVNLPDDTSDNPMIPVLIVGDNETDTTLASLGKLTVPRLVSTYGFTEREAKRTNTFLSSVAVPESRTDTVKSDILPAVRQALKTNKTSTRFATAFSQLADTRPDIAYALSSAHGKTAFMKSSRFRNSGLTDTNLEEAVAILRGNRTEEDTTPVYALPARETDNDCDTVLLDRAGTQLAANLPDSATVVFGGGNAATSLAHIAGLSAPALVKNYGYPAVEAEKAAELLRSITVPDGKSPEAAALLPEVKESIGSVSTAKDLRKELARRIGSRSDAAFNLSTPAGQNAFASIPRFIESGYQKADLSRYLREVRGQDVRPVYASSFTSPARLTPPVIKAPRTAGNIPSVGDSPRVSVDEVAPIMTSRSSRSATVPSASAMTTGSPATPVSPARAPASATAARSAVAVPTSPARSAKDTEIERLKRIEANYKKDKAMLAKERAPALARSDTHDVGHAEGTDQDNQDIKRIAKQLSKNVKDELARRKG